MLSCQVTLCDQVEAYLARFAGGEKAPEVAAAAVAVAAPQGTRALVKEVDLLEDKYTLSGSGGKKVHSCLPHNTRTPTVGPKFRAGVNLQILLWNCTP